MNETPAQQPAFTYEWQWRVQMTIPPPQKTAGSNNGTWAGAMSLYLSNTNQAAQDVSSTFRSMKTGDTIRIESKTDASVWSLWTLGVPPIDYGTCFTFPVSQLTYQGAPIDNTVYRAVITTGVLPAATERITITAHLLNLSVIANGMLTQGNISLETVGDDTIKVYDKLVRAYLETPELPQPVPPPALPQVLTL